jgi:ATP-dependent Clp protease protease subunit
MYDAVSFQVMLLPSVQVLAASMAAVLLVAVLKANVLRLPHSRVMIHQPMGGAQGQASDIEITAREIQEIEEKNFIRSSPIIRILISIRYGRTLTATTWMTAQEAKEYGMIDVGID